MQTPTQPNITVDPELAILNVLDVAAHMTIGLLMIFHPGVDDSETRADRGHFLANRIITDAHRLRRSLDEYQQALEFERDLHDADIPF